MTTPTRTMPDAIARPTIEVTGFEAFVIAHWDRLVGLAELVSGDVAAAEDIVQTALERAWRSRASLHAEDLLRPWLDKIVVREAARARRSRLRWVPRLFRAPAVTSMEVAEARVEDADATRFPEQTAIAMALATLSSSHRAVVVLHLHAGYSVEETARIVGAPRETVRSRLRVAREHLRHALGEAHR